MSSKIQIFANQALERGQKLPVEILVTFDKPTKVRGIRAVFLGREITQADFSTTDLDGNSSSSTATQYQQIAKEEYLLLGQERKVCCSRICDSMKTLVGGGSYELIPAGEKSFSIDVMIPDDAPPTMKGKHCRVKYEVQVSVDIPIKCNWNRVEELPVARTHKNFAEAQPVHAFFPDEKGGSFWNKTFGKNVTLNLAVDQDKLRVGDQAMAMLTVKSPKPLNVNKIQFALVGKETTQARGYKDNAQIRHPLGQANSPGVISSESVHEFGFSVPPLEWPISQVGTNFEIALSIEVKLDVPWAKNPVIRVPIEIHPNVKAIV